MIVATKTRESSRRANSPVTRAKESDATFRPWSELPAPQTLPVHATAPLCPAIGMAERTFALGCLLAASPLLLLIALAVKITSPGGPILYRQERVGLDRRRSATAPPEYQGSADRRRNGQAGQIFSIYKFRTMLPNAEKLTGPVWATDKDPRVTRFGHFLRHLRLDELPQLINVVQGRMSLIGPRPERPFFVGQLSEQIPEYASRLRVPPGITGLAQIERSYDGTVDDVKKKLKYDLYYAKNKCALLDAKILLRTIDVVLRGRGAR